MATILRDVGLKGAVKAAFNEGLGELAGGVEFDGDGLAALAAGGFEDGEVKMGAGGVAGVAGGGDPIAGFDEVADFDPGAGFLEVDVVAQGAVGVANEDVVGVPFVFFVGAAAAGIVFDANNNAVAGGADVGAFGHFEINGEFVAAGVTEGAVEALGDWISFTGRERERVDVGVVVVDVEVAPGGEVGVRPVGFVFGIEAGDGEEVGAGLGRDSDGAGQRGGGFVVGELGLDGDGDVGGLKVLDEEGGAVGGTLVGDVDQLFGGESVTGESEKDEQGGRPDPGDQRARGAVGVVQQRHFKKLEKKGTPAEEEASARLTRSR